MLSTGGDGVQRWVKVEDSNEPARPTGATVSSFIAFSQQRAFTAGQRQSDWADSGLGEFTLGAFSLSNGDK